MTGIENYIENSFSISKYLRSGEVKIDGKYSKEEITSFVEDIDNMFLNNINSYSMKSSYSKLYRGENSCLNTFNVNINNIEEGDVLISKGFISTSKNEDLAKEYSSTGIMLYIAFEKGVKGMEISNFSQDSDNNRFEEVLLNRNSSFRVDWVDEKEIGLTLLK